MHVFVKVPWWFAGCHPRQHVWRARSRRARTTAVLPRQLLGGKYMIVSSDVSRDAAIK